jgi:outer membrane protein OmpA-like peptidoglycan-associated protein
MERTMKKPILIAASLAILAAPAFGQGVWDAAKGIAGKGTVGPLEKQINKKLLEESRKNQCSFKTNSDELEAGCDAKAKKLAVALIDAKKKLNGAGVKNFKFEVSGHTDTTGSADANKALSEKRAAVMKRELVAKGVAADEIIVVGAGSSRPLVKPDDTPAKKAKNRRYEIQVRL